jgi:hypothetical protein
VRHDTFLLGSLGEALAVWGRYDTRPEAIQRTHEAVAYLTALHGAPSEFRLTDSGEDLSVAFGSSSEARLDITAGFLQSPEPVPGFVPDPDVSGPRDAFRCYFPEREDGRARGGADGPDGPDC